MAESPAHRWGQIIGYLLEEAVKPLLSSFATEYGFYLDSKEPRPARRGLKEVVWVDKRGNKHKLDYVVERGGTKEEVGKPVAFIEVAWRRFTKHSKNKAQEIEAAIQPLLTKHEEAAPFFGVILGGVFTTPALNQLRSTRCSVLYFTYESILAAFKTANIDASTEENTPLDEYEAKLKAWDSLTPSQKQHICRTLIDLNKENVDLFMDELKRVASRQIESIRILPLQGFLHEFVEIEIAMIFIEQFTTNQSFPVVRYEIQIRFNNGSVIEAKFVDKASAIEFLHGYQSPAKHLAQPDEIDEDIGNKGSLIDEFLN